MYKRVVKPIKQFIDSDPPCGIYVLYLQFGRLGYCDKDVCLTINTRIDASGATYLVEIYE